MLEVADIYVKFIQYLRDIKSYSEHTLEAYGRDLEQWLQYLNENELPWNEISKQNINSFIANYPRKITRRTQARKLTVLRSFYGFCRRQNFMEQKLSIAQPRYKRSLPKPIRGIELEAILDDDSGQKRFIQIRDRTLLSVMYSSGLRISELLALNPENVLIQEEIVEQFTVTGKGKKDRIVFLGDDARTLLRLYLPERDKVVRDHALFINARGKRLSRRGANYIIKTRAQNLNISDQYSAHSLRHSFATDLIDSGADIRNVQELLGHSSVSTTQNYVYVAKEKIKQTFWNHHPHARAKEE